MQINFFQPGGGIAIAFCSTDPDTNLLVPLLQRAQNQVLPLSVVLQGGPQGGGFAPTNIGVTNIP